MFLSLPTTAVENIFLDFFRSEYNARKRRKILTAALSENLTKRGLKEEILKKRKAKDLKVDFQVTVPQQFFHENHLEKLRKVQAIASKFQVDLQYFASIPRNSFLKNGMEATRPYLHLIKSDFIRGLDISGSLGGDKLETRLKYIEVSKLFISLFEFCTYHGLDTRVHAFEASNKGNFYDGLRHAVQTYEGVFPEIILGHATRLTEAWLKLFWARVGSFRADLNLASAEFLQPDANIKKVLDLFAEDMKRSLETHGRAGGLIKRFSLGSDGLGMLPHSSFVNQIMRLIHLAGSELACEMVFENTRIQGNIDL